MKRVLAVVLATTVALAACDSGSGGTSESGTPTSGGTLTFAVGSDQGCVDPQQVGSNDTIYSLRQIVDSLTDQDPRTGKIVPWLAESWDVSPDAKTFTFHLKSGTTFSDGTPVDAAAVKANFDAAPKLGPKAQLAIGYLSGLTSTKVLDPKTVEVTFAQPNAQFLQATSTFSLGLVSIASTRKTPDQRCTDGVVGSGPFVLDQYVANQSITLSKRKGYRWGSSLWTKKGEAYLDKLVFRVIPEAGVRTGSLQSGQVDAIGSVGLADESALKAGGVVLNARANPGLVFGLLFNNSGALGKDPAVRHAVLAAIDRQQIVDAIFPTGSKPATSILAHTTPYYANLSAKLAHDPDQAKTLLDAAGWKAGPDGIRTKNGIRLSLAVTWAPNAATNQPTLELLQQQLKAVGVEITLKEIQIAQFTEVLVSGKFDVFWGNATRADPDILRSSFSTHLANFYHLSPSALDQALAGQAAASDPAKRGALVKQAQELIVENAYAVPVVELTTELGVGKNVHNLDFEASSRIQLHDTWKS
ncbi:ABC transporter substrate-binding protein [Cryptosporangium sp. NPDC051539]|uniref:ABC transporter substrate-binding protein n=1 Tax=Cryptosporangium sp. NPDC051539 TaxID=3363962 RepID=UPI0037878CCC